LNTEIVNIKHQQHRAISATDQNGNEFNADMFVSDMDPQMTFELCNIPPTKKYDYQYTYSCFSLFLGLKNIKLSDYSLGNFNVWYYPDDNLDEDCELVLRDLDYSKSYLFISTPSAHVDPGVLSPEGSQTMQVVVPASYEAIVKLYNDSPSDYAAIKEKIKNEILDTLSAKFIPDIRQYIDVIEFWSPLDLSNKVKTPCGALYGMRPDVRKLVWPVGHNSPLKNLYFVGATSSYAGLGPVINGAMKLFDELHSENRVTS
jgi:phytoene dehydrogenase-like protein